LESQSTSIREIETTIMTSHSETALWRMNAFIDANINKASSTDVTINEVTYSHPPAWAKVPSGFYLNNGAPTEPIDGDRKITRDVEKRYNKNVVRFGLYNGTTGNYSFYNSSKIYYQER